MWHVPWGFLRVRVPAMGMGVRVRLSVPGVGVRLHGVLGVYCTVTSWKSAKFGWLWGFGGREGEETGGRDVVCWLG